MQQFVGQDAALQLQTIIQNASISDKGSFAAVIGIVTLLLGATAVFAEIQDSINTIWGFKAKPKKGLWKIIRNRFLSFSVVVSLGFLLLVSLAISTILEGLSDQLKARFPNVTVAIFYILNLIISFIVITSLFAVIFKVLPDAKTKWKDILPGSVGIRVLIHDRQVCHFVLYWKKPCGHYLWSSRFTCCTVVMGLLFCDYFVSRRRICKKHGHPIKVPRSDQMIMQSH
jgi:membrane protein